MLYTKEIEIIALDAHFDDDGRTHIIVTVLNNRTITSCVYWHLYIPEDAPMHSWNGNIIDVPAGGTKDKWWKIGLAPTEPPAIWKLEIGMYSGGAPQPGENPTITDVVEFTVTENGEIGEICQWIQSVGGPSGLTIEKVFQVIDAYILEIPIQGYSFIPTLNEIFGVIDYYLGFNGDNQTGCNFYG